MPDFGTIKEVALTAIWPHEAADFTPWLAEHLDALSSILDMDLELIEIEAAVGDFALDILARDLQSQRYVIIENQLTKTDHDHLGKLLTYAAGHDAETIVWISKNIRDEHRRTLEWLNQRTDEATRFFGIVVEVFRIDDSKPAFVLKPVVRPNEWLRETTRSTSKPASSRGEAYRAFFQSLIDVLREKHRFTGLRRAQSASWCSYTSGIRGVPFGTSFSADGRARVELYFDISKDAELNKRVFSRVTEARSSIEAAFGEPLEFEALDARRACRIACYFPGSILASPDRLVEIRDEMVNRLLRMKSVVPIVKKIVEEAVNEDFTDEEESES